MSASLVCPVQHGGWRQPQRYNRDRKFPLCVNFLNFSMCNAASGVYPIHLITHDGNFPPRVSFPDFLCCLTQLCTGMGITYGLGWALVMWSDFDHFLCLCVCDLVRLFFVCLFVFCLFVCFLLRSFVVCVCISRCVSFVDTFTCGT